MQSATPAYPRSLLVFALLYGGMVTIAGVLGAKQVAIGPLAVEAGIFPFLTLVAISSGISQLHGHQTATALARFGLIPLIVAIALTYFVLSLPTDPGMYEPAKAAFPVILAQSGRMMIAGICAYAVSLTLNLWIFRRLAGAEGRFAGFRGFVAAALSQIVDTIVFITISFWGVRAIGGILLGQALAKVLLSAVLVPLIIWIVVRVGARLDARD